MIKRLEFTIPGEPQGKGRARVVQRGDFTHSYTPEKTANYENFIKLLAIDAMKEQGVEKMTGPVDVTIFPYFKIPKSASKKKRQLMETGEILPCKKPDVSNIAKAVEDALNGLVYEDDAQICSLVVSKYYTSPGQEPCVTVQVMERMLTEEQMLNHA